MSEPNTHRESDEVMNRLPVIHDHSGPSTAAVRIEPAVTPESEPYWAAACEGRLMVERCRGCETYSFPPRGVCPSCRTFDMAWVDISGSGELYSFTVNQQEWLPGVGRFALGLVEFPSSPGVRILGRMSDGFDLEALEVGLGVELVFARSQSGPPIPFVVPGGRR